MIRYVDRSTWGLPYLLCLVVGLLGTLPLVIVTPPFQVPDEPAQFERAYQISEGTLLAQVQDGAAGGVVPASLAALTRQFLGTDAILAPRTTIVAPLARSLRADAITLDAGRRRFADFTNTAGYPPIAYLPQVVAIWIGRALGAGPLLLLYLTRAINLVAAITILALAIGLMPVGRAPAMVAGLLPMALYEYASASQDALVISSGFLLTALGLRALQRGTWRRSEVLGAAAAGLVVCASKLVYAPLLLIAVPAALVPAQRSNQLRALATILMVALGGTALWLVLNAGRVIAFEPGAAIHAQARFVLTHPLDFVLAIMHSAHWQAWFYVTSTIGIFGWLTVAMPGYAYVSAGATLLGACLIGETTDQRLSLSRSTWCAFLLAGAVVLTFLAMYLDTTPVGAPVVLGVQGRYFLPLLALVTAVAGSLPMPRVGRGAAVVLLIALAGGTLLEAGLAMYAIVGAFRVF